MILRHSRTRWFLILPSIPMQAQWCGNAKGEIGGNSISLVKVERRGVVSGEWKWVGMMGWAG